MNNLALCESKSLREEQLREVSQDRALEILDKAKALVMAIHQGSGVATTQQIAGYFEVSIETIQSTVKSNRLELQSDGLRLASGRELKDVLSVIDKSDSPPTLTLWTPRSALRCGMLLRDSEVAKQVRTILLDTISQKVSLQKLEGQFRSEVSIKSIDEAATVLGKRFGSAYEQRFLIQNIKKHQPSFDLPSIEPQESASLPTTKALLTPTQIAKELGLFCKSKPENPSPQKVNKLLEQLGYQTKIAGVWSATDKAINLNLVDRKPVSTKSSTQQDQMLWSADIIPILQEHTLKC